MILGFLVSACIRRGQVPDAPVAAGSGPAAAAADLVGPARWDEVDGPLCWNVPEGWSGHTGPGPTVALTHPATGLGVTLTTETWPPSEGIRPPTGWSVRFSDAAAYRRVPLLYPAATWTLVTEAARGPTWVRYRGRVLDRAVVVDLLMPPGTVLMAEVADPLLAGLCLDR